MSNSKKYNSNFGSPRYTRGADIAKKANIDSIISPRGFENSNYHNSDFLKSDLKEYPIKNNPNLPNIDKYN